MRKIYAFVLYAAVAAVSLVSCQKEISNPNEGSRTVHFTVKASLDPQTRTYLSETDGIYSAKWSYNPSESIADQIGVFFGDFENNVTATDAVFEITDVTSDVATFSGEGVVSADAVTFTSFYPASAFVKTYANSCIGLKVEKTQTPVLGSFDPDMDILMGKQKDITISSTNVELDDLQFARVMAILRVNVNAKDNSADVAGKTITSLKLIAANTTLTGTASVSAETAKINTWTQSNNEVIANIDASESVTVNETDGVNSVFLVVNPTTIAAGTSLTFTVGMSDGTTYTRILTAPAMEFLSAKVTEINLTLRDKDLVDADYSGDYLIVSKGDATNWAVMNKTLTTNSSASYFGATATEVAYNAVVDFTSSSVTFGDFSDADHKWTLTKVSGGYTIEDADGQYLGVTSATHATLNDDPVTLKVEAEAENVYAITNADASLALKYNSGSPRFTFYASGQQDLYLIPFAETCKAPVITCVNNQVSISCGTPDATVYYTIDGTTEPTSSASVYSAPFTITANTTVKAIAIKSGAASSYVVTKLCEFSNSGAEYIKVTEAPSDGDWSGRYLIVAESASKILIPEFNGTSGGKATAVTISSSKIGSTASIDANAWTIERDGNTSNYTVNNGSLYLGWDSGNAARSYTSVTSAKAKNTFAISGDAALIKNSADNSRVLRFNPGVTDANGPFRYYTSSTGEAAVLYKYTISDGKYDAGVTLSYNGGSITYGDSPVQLTLTNPNGVAVTCTSSATSVANVTNAGLITITGAGDAIITAAWDEQTISGITYREGSVTYELTVAKKTPTIAAFSTPTTSVDKGATVTNTTTISDGLTITYISSNESVATVTSAGVVTGVDDGTAIISATFAGNDNFNAATPQTYTITVGAGSGTDYASLYSSNVDVGSETISVEGKEYDCAKAGTSKAGGSVSITVPAGTTKLHVHMAAYSTGTPTISITGGDADPSSIQIKAGGISGNSPYTLTTGNGTDHYYLITLSNVSAPTTVTFETASGGINRFVLWGVNAE